MLQRVVQRYGDISCVYLGDTARVPFGYRKPREIRTIAREIVYWLKKQKASSLLIACNTTNSLAHDIVESLSEMPVVGLIEAASQMITESRVGVLATPATVASRAYSNQIKSYRPGTVVFEQGCPAFVPLIEAGFSTSNEIGLVASEYLKPLLEEQVEAVIMGCSHYPLLEPVLRELLPSHVRLVDPAVGLVNLLHPLLGDPSTTLEKTPTYLNTRFCVTSNPSCFANRVEGWIGFSPEVELVSLQD